MPSKVTKPLFLGFSTNAFPADDLNHLTQNLFPRFKSLFTNITNQKDKQPFQWSLDLQLGSNILKDLYLEQNSLLLKEKIEQHQLYIGSLNLFPLCPFQNIPVKTKVYQPNWFENERHELTSIGAHWVAHYLKPDFPFSISTLAGKFHPEGNPSEGDFKDLSKQLKKFCQQLHQLKDETGCHIFLALEPEPFTTLQQTNDVLSLWKYCDDPYCQEHLSINLDCCHFSVMGEEPLNALKIFQNHNIPITKIHASTSLDIKNPYLPEKKQFIKSIDEPYFLHQTVLHAHQGNQKRYYDLPQSFEHIDQDIVRLTCHFHMPLFIKNHKHNPGTSCDQTIDLIQHIINQPSPNLHIYAETYTWSVFKTQFAKDAEDGISQELTWLTQQLNLDSGSHFARPE